ncbi:hypothetical protein GQ57_30880 [Burkholderia sp. MSh2]|nr:hypothetical protein GQ57_30880 [Burkholderia sp. MSh2]
MQNVLARLGRYIRVHGESRLVIAPVRLSGTNAVLEYVLSIDVMQFAARVTCPLTRHRIQGWNYRDSEHLIVTGFVQRVVCLGEYFMRVRA